MVNMSESNMSAESSDPISVEVAYALPNTQKIVVVEVVKGATARQAAMMSGLDKDFDDVDLQQAPLGIFGNALGARGMPKAEDYVLNDGDRVEIYRPLIADPKQARRQRAAKKD